MNSVKHCTLTAKKLAERVIIISSAAVMIKRLCSPLNKILSASRGASDEQQRIKISLPRKHINCSAVALAGISVALLPGGQTSHNAFKFPILVFENSVSSIKTSSNAGRELQMKKSL